MIPATEGAITWMVPEGAKPVHVEIDLVAQQVLIWLVIDDVDAAKVKRRFRIYETGEEIDPHAAYIGTVKSQKLVLHIFEEAIAL